MHINFGQLQDYLYMIPVILISLTFHEFSHAYVSYKLGDPTAKNSGRLTLNPLKHLDIFGTIMMFIAQIGWAKPVPINPIYYRDRKKGTMLVSLAGPLSNVFLAFLTAIAKLYIENRYYGVGNTIYLPSENMVILYHFIRLFFYANIGLAAFNILPIPPLDGSKILSGIMPSEQYFKFMRYENQIGMIFLFLVIVSPNLISRILYPFRWAIETGVVAIVKPIIQLLV